MSVSVIICGLVRNQERLRKKLKNYFDWREQGRIDQIIYSTWIGEVDNYPELREYLLNNQVELIEVEEPRLVLKGGHQLHQMLAFFYGLSAIKNRNQFIMKTRVDLADNHEAMLYDFEHGTEEVEDILNVGLKHKVLIEYSQMIYPFLCGDAQFFGHYDDLCKLVNLNADMELVYNRLAVEQTFFFHPFKEVKLLQEHFYWNSPHISEMSIKREEQVNDILIRDNFVDIISSWWLILHQYFKVGWGEYKDLHIELKDMYSAFHYNKDMKIIGGDLSDVVADHSFVTALYKLISKEKEDYLVNLLNQKSFNNIVEYPVDKYNQYASFVKKYSDLPSPKLPQMKNGKVNFIIRGAAQHFFVKDVNDAASKRYHEQITALRRENDLLKKELNINFTHTYIHRFMNRFMSRKTIEMFKYRYPKMTNIYAKYFMKKKG
jgi:hypothetical protein